jgi:hypothetical protein
MSFSVLFFWYPGTHFASFSIDQELEVRCLEYKEFRYDGIFIYLIVPNMKDFTFFNSG